jgi:hypothetical protein
MNAKIETPPVTTPNALTPHDALVLDVATRLQSIGRAVSESTELHYADQAEQLGRLLSELNLEYMRLGSAREQAFEAAAEAAENEWNAANNAGMP